MEYVASHRCDRDRMTDQSQPLWWSPDGTHNVIAYIRPQKSFVWPKTDNLLVRFLSFHRTFSSPLCAGTGDKIESATYVPLACCVTAPPVMLISNQSSLRCCCCPHPVCRSSIRRRCKIGRDYDCGGRFRPPLLSLGIVVTRSLLILAPLSLPLRTYERLVHHAPVSTAGRRERVI